MTPEAAALQAASVLLHAPTQVRVLRAAVLPEATSFLLRLAAGEIEALQHATSISNRTDVQLRKAALFFIEQILLAPEADSYRVLGGGPQSTSAELRRNMALLLRVVHPDLGASAEHSKSAARVTRAWEDIKTPERRVQYDLSSQKALSSSGKKRSHARDWKRQQNEALVSRQKDHSREPSLVRRALAFLLRSRDRETRP